MGLGPVGEGRDRTGERGAERGELVVDTGRHLGVDGAGEQAVALHRAQGLGEHLGGDAADAGAQLAEAQRSVLERADDQHGPLVADPVEHDPGGAVGVEGVAALIGNHEVLIAR